MKVLFITGTRADFGKIKRVLLMLNETAGIELSLFVTGMHMLKKFGNTHVEIDRLGLENIYKYINQNNNNDMSEVLASTITGLNNYLQENNQDLIVVHGDRIEALAGSIVGSLENTHVLHLEGGERSGTIDESIRHAISKFSHMHFVVNDEAGNRLKQLGETDIYSVGSSNIDIMLSKDLPSLKEVRKRYDINFSNYAILIFHPVTTESDMYEQTEALIQACDNSDKKFVVILPNNDKGCEKITTAYSSLGKKYRVLPSMRFEYYLSLLKNADFIIGNSSSGIHEAPVYGIPTINIGTRQSGRASFDSIRNSNANIKDINDSIKWAMSIKKFSPNYTNGDGKSAERIVQLIKELELSSISIQKSFRDLA